VYYWNGNNEIEKELLNFENVKFFKVASAFFSNEGLKILEKVHTKYQLSRKNIIIYLSEEFSTDEPHTLLEKILDIATVKIVTRRKLHAKVFLLVGELDKHKVVFGSANMTKGGFEHNIEFDQIEVVNDISEFNRFFKYIDYKSVEVNADVIAYYESKKEHIEELKKKQHELRKTLAGYFKSEDPFDVDEYYLEKSYFNYQDYEVFFPRNSRLNDSEIRNRRKIVQNKILKLHNGVYSKIKKYGIECHWRPDNVSSLINPSVYNHYNVGWLGVRYGKTKKELDILNKSAEDDVIGFQKHGCIQFCLIPSGFEINLFLSVRNDSFDRADLHQKFLSKRDNIENELHKLKGLGLIWEIDDGDEVKRFEFDNSDVSDFYDFYMKNDKSGCTSYLLLYYAPNDSRIQTFEQISDEILKYTKKLLPLYNLMVFRIKT